MPCIRTCKHPFGVALSPRFRIQPRHAYEYGRMAPGCSTQLRRKRPWVSPHARYHLVCPCSPSWPVTERAKPVAPGKPNDPPTPDAPSEANDPLTLNAPSEPNRTGQGAHATRSPCQSPSMRRANPIGQSGRAPTEPNSDRAERTQRRPPRRNEPNSEGRTAHAERTQRSLCFVTERTQFRSRCRPTTPKMPIEANVARAERTHGSLSVAIVLDGSSRRNGKPGCPTEPNDNRADRTQPGMGLVTERSQFSSPCPCAERTQSLCNPLNIKNSWQIQIHPRDRAERTQCPLRRTNPTRFEPREPEIRPDRRAQRPPDRIQPVNQSSSRRPADSVIRSNEARVVV